MTAASASAVSVSGPSGGNADGDGGEQAVSTGDRISVYWPDDGKWYDGRVHSEVAAGWWVHYDDGDKQVHDLKAERYKVLSLQASKVSSWSSSAARGEEEGEDDKEEGKKHQQQHGHQGRGCLLYTSPSPRD